MESMAASETTMPFRPDLRGDNRPNREIVSKKMQALMPRHEHGWRSRWIAARFDELSLAGDTP
jgi:hypothetical protein